MKEIKGYTPGKWEIIENHPVFGSKKIIAVKDEENSNSFRDKYILICEMTGIRGDSFTDNSEYIEANAALIVSAPSLYEENVKLREALGKMLQEFPQSGVQLTEREQKVVDNCMVIYVNAIK